MPNSIQDALPDACGRRVILNKISGSKANEKDTNDLSELLYLLESGFDRIGALDFQESANQYTTRLNANVSLEDLLSSSENVEKGIPLSRELMWLQSDPFELQTKMCSSSNDLIDSDSNMVGEENVLCLS